MVFADDLAIFFNPEEFGITAVIDGKPATGLFNYGTVLVNDVEVRKPVFTCIEKALPAIMHGSLVKIRQQKYQVIGIKSDGAGLVTLILEQASDEI